MRWIAILAVPLLIAVSPLGVADISDAVEDMQDAIWQETGRASYYAARLHGHYTANGERYDQTQLTAAHPSLAFGTHVCVTNLYNGRETVVRINDRGPFVGNRIIDLSRRAALDLGMIQRGVARVRLTLCDEDNN